MKKRYYSIRTKKRSDKYDLPILKRLFVTLYNGLDSDGYLQEYFGYWCVDAQTPNNWIPGKLGIDIEEKVFRILLKEIPWPPNEIDLDGDNIDQYSEDDLFDVIEFLYDYVTSPVDGQYHSFNNCGWHYSTFDKKSGQRDFVNRINDILQNYKDGYEISRDGQILVKEERALSDIFKAKIPSKKKDVKTKIKLAIEKYRSSRSDMEERRIAIRELADILESLRDKAKKLMLSKDESALFELANKFAIRHSNKKQIKHYDKNIWYSWMFYFYLSSIHTLLRLIEKHDKTK